MQYKKKHIFLFLLINLGLFNQLILNCCDKDIFGSANLNNKSFGSLNIYGASKLKNIKCVKKSNFSGSSTIEDSQFDDQLTVNGSAELKNVQCYGVVDIKGSGNINNSFFKQKININGSAIIESSQVQESEVRGSATIELSQVQEIKVKGSSIITNSKINLGYFYGDAAFTECKQLNFLTFYAQGNSRKPYNFTLKDSIVKENVRIIVAPGQKALLIIEGTTVLEKDIIIDGDCDISFDNDKQIKGKVIRK